MTPDPKTRTDAEPDLPLVAPPNPDTVSIEDHRRKYQYVATYHGPSDILEYTDHDLQLMRDVPTDVAPAAAEALEDNPDVTVETISLVEDNSETTTKKGK